MNVTQSVILSLALVGVIGSYGVCYTEGNCTCALVGQCYGSTLLPDCKVPTCLVAETTQTVWNTCPGPGSYTGRVAEGIADQCCPLSCRAWDACAAQYIEMTGGLCCFQVMHYLPTGSGCK
jgi:hypothetical protein